MLQQTCLGRHILQHRVRVVHSFGLLLVVVGLGVGGRLREAQRQAGKHAGMSTERGTDAAVATVHALIHSGSAPSLTRPPLSLPVGVLPTVCLTFACLAKNRPCAVDRSGAAETTARRSGAALVAICVASWNPLALCVTLIRIVRARCMDGSAEHSRNEQREQDRSARKKGLTEQRNGGPNTTANGGRIARSHDTIQATGRQWMHARAAPPGLPGPHDGAFPNICRSNDVNDRKPFKIIVYIYETSFLKLPSCKPICVTPRAKPSVKGLQQSSLRCARCGDCRVWCAVVCPVFLLLVLTVVSSPHCALPAAPPPRTHIAMSGPSASAGKPRTMVSDARFKHVHQDPRFQVREERGATQSTPPPPPQQQADRAVRRREAERGGDSAVRGARCEDTRDDAADGLRHCIFWLGAALRTALRVCESSTESAHRAAPPFAALCMCSARSEI